MQSEDKADHVDSAFCTGRSASFTFPRSHRLSGKILFSLVYEAKVKSSKGPLLAYSRPNQLGHARLGISISRRVGIAPKRNRIKRLIREAFRLAFPKCSMDLIIVVRPHTPLPLPDYQKIMNQLIEKARVVWNGLSGNAAPPTQQSNKSQS